MEGNKNTKFIYTVAGLVAVIVLMAVNLLFGTTSQNSSNPWGTLGEKQNFTFEERVERGEFNHAYGFEEGLRSIEMVYDYDFTDLKMESVDGKEIKFSDIKANNNLPTLVIVNNTTIEESNKAIENMLKPAINKDTFNVVYLLVSDGENLDVIKRLVEEGDKDIYGNVGIIGNTDVRRMGLEFTPMFVYLNSNNVTKNAGLPHDNLQTIILLGMAEGNIKLNEASVYTYQKAFEEEIASEEIEENDKVKESDSEDVEIDVEDVEAKEEDKEKEDSAVGSVPIVLPTELEYGTDFKDISEENKDGKFKHIEDDEEKLQFLTDNYGINMYAQEVEDNQGNVRKIGDIVEDKGKPTVIIFGRHTWPYCVDLWNRFKNEPLRDANVIDLASRGTPEEYKEFSKEINNEGLYDNIYYNIEHLLNLLNVQYVPTVIVLSPEGSLVNVIPAGMSTTEMQDVINQYIGK